MSTLAEPSSQINYKMWQVLGKWETYALELKSILLLIIIATLKHSLETVTQLP